MNYNSIILLKDSSIYLYINDKKLNLSLNNSIMNNGIILDNERFIKNYYKLLKDNKISTFFWNKKIIVIYDSLISKNDLQVIKNIFIDLNYRDVKLISDSSLINLNKKDEYLLLGDKYKFYYIDRLNNKKLLVIDKDILSTREINELIEKRAINKNLFIVGNIKQIKLKNDINYFIYDSYSEFFFNILKHDK